MQVASTVWYFSNPGPAPTELLKQSRHELEIVPLVLPRRLSRWLVWVAAAVLILLGLRRLVF